LSSSYAELHDEAKWQTVLRLLEISPSSCVPNDSPEAQRRARERALLSMRHGGLGLRCAARANVSAYWSAPDLPGIDPMTRACDGGGLGT
jgi:hypothetical protein